MPTFARRGALKMYVGEGDNARTRYHCAVIDQARANHVQVLRLPGEYGNPRRMHRPNLFAAFSKNHPDAGKGRYIDLTKVETVGRTKIVHGAHHVNPYVPGDGSYRVIVSVFHQIAGELIKRLDAEVRFSRQDGEHFEWSNSRNNSRVEDSLVITRWYRARELYDLAHEFNRRWLERLRHSSSPRPGVDEEARLGTFEKFEHALLVMHRARWVKNVATGEREEHGGATPYAMPLEQCGFALDIQHMTYGIDNRGVEQSDLFYRMAYGRNFPYQLTYEDWSASVTEPYAYLNEQVRRQALAQRAAG